MTFFSKEEWEKHVAERKKARDDVAKKKRLMRRQKRLRSQLYRHMDRFRRDEKLQTELRRVAALCIKLGVPLDPGLEREILRSVMES